MRVYAARQRSQRECLKFNAQNNTNPFRLSLPHNECGNCQQLPLRDDVACSGNQERRTLTNLKWDAIVGTGSAAIPSFSIPNWCCLRWAFFQRAAPASWAIFLGPVPVHFLSCLMVLIFLFIWLVNLVYRNLYYCLGSCYFLFTVLWFPVFRDKITC
jgi:hypothetical protein